MHSGNPFQFYVCEWYRTVWIPTISKSIAEVILRSYKVQMTIPNMFEIWIQSLNEQQKYIFSTQSYT